MGNKKSVKHLTNANEITLVVEQETGGFDEFTMGIIAKINQCINKAYQQGYQEGLRTGGNGYE